MNNNSTATEINFTENNDSTFFLYLIIIIITRNADSWSFLLKVIKEGVCILDDCAILVINNY